MLIFGCVAAGMMILAPPVAAQERAEPDPLGLMMDREDLLELLDEMQAAARSPAYSEALRDRATAEVALIRARLEDGDFQIGDRLILVVEQQEALTDTFTVSGSRSLVLPEVGPVPLAGVLRAELEPYMSQYLSGFVRNPRVHAEPLVRIEIVGGVPRPGFYSVPGDAVLTDVIMLAGGPTSRAKTDAMRVERAGTTIRDSGALRQAVIDGRTIGQLDLRGGDRVVIPEGAGLTSAEGALRFVTLMLSVAVAAAAIFP